MKKFWMITVISCLLVGCQNTTTTTEDSGEESLYASYYHVIEDNDQFLSSSEYYTISCEMGAMSDGTYRYYIFLDEPQVAMYDVIMMAVINDIPYEENNAMMPTIGVFDTTEYNLIPYQSNSDAGYVKGLILSGDTSESIVHVKLLVEWSNEGREKTKREFLSFDIDNSQMANESVDSNA